MEAEGKEARVGVEEGEVGAEGGEVGAEGKGGGGGGFKNMSTVKSNYWMAIVSAALVNRSIMLS